MGVFNFNIPEDEQLLTVAKAHWTSYLVVGFKVITASVVLGAAVTGLWPFWWENKWARIGLIVFIVGGVLYCLLDFWKRFLTTYLVTQCRVIDITQEKILRRVVTEINLEEIEEVIVRKTGGINKIFHKGNVLIKLNNKKGVLVLYDLKNPEQTKDTIVQLLEQTKEIINQKGEECNVTLQDNKTHSVPLSYAYYGDRKKRAEKNGNALSRTVRGNGLVVVKKKKK